MTQLSFQRTVLIGVISTAKINPIDNKKERKKNSSFFLKSYLKCIRSLIKSVGTAPTTECHVVAQHQFGAQLVQPVLLFACLHFRNQGIELKKRNVGTRVYG